MTRAGNTGQYRAPSDRPSPLLKPLGDPDLDQRLTGHAEAAGFGVETIDHAGREIDIDALGLLRRARAVDQSINPLTFLPSSKRRSNSSAVIVLLAVI